MRTPQWFTHLLLMVALLATIPATAYGQPPAAPPAMVEVESDDPETDGQSEGQVLNDDTSSPAIPPPPQTAQQPEPVPAPTPADQTVHEYGDREAETWKNYHYPPAATRVVQQYIQNGLSPTSVVRRYEYRFVRPIVVQKDGNHFAFLEPGARNAKDRRLNRKMFFDAAAQKNFLTVVSTKAGYQARFRQDKTDEIATWIVTESSADVSTALQMTLRNFIVDEFAPLKEQVGKNTAALTKHEQDILQLKADVKALQDSTGTTPGTVVAPANVTSVTPPAPVPPPEAPKEEIAVGNIIVAPATPTPVPEASETPVPKAEETPTPTPKPSETPSIPEDLPTASTAPERPPIVTTSLQAGSSGDSWPWLGGLLVLALGGALMGARYYRKSLTPTPVIPPGPPGGGI